ncbi:hypothetical protein RB595_004069 [Gaeumannomyces hyphopodioides]
MSITDSNKLYALQEVPGKGLGLVAATKIAKGTRILSEAPLLRVPRFTNSKEQVCDSLSNKVAALSDDKRQAFFSLHNSFEDETTRELGITRTNALPLGFNAATGGIFVEASRINHACIQNAQNTWNEGLQQLTIHAIRDINRGEEITIMYLTDRANRAARQRTLQRNFRFTCSCQLCLLPPSLRASSDARLDEIQRLDKSIGDGIQITASPLQALHDVRKLLKLSEEEGLHDASVPRAYYDAFQIAVVNGDRARAKVFGERAAATRAIVEGDDSPTVRRMKDLVGDPTRHPSYGHSSRWQTSTDNTPSSLSAADFETWLWREEKEIPQEQPQHTDLRDEATFPSFNELPEENDLDLEFYESTDGFSYHPRKNWCFLAEIIEIENFLRLRFIVKDGAGHDTVVAFYTPSRGRELDPSCIRKGFTLAILYAEQHGFLDMSTGVRLEDPTVLKIFPVPLRDLFTLSDKVQQYAGVVNGERTCQGCGHKATTLSKCGKCTLFWYCDKECQTIAWKNKGHKADCKLLRDQDLQMLLSLNKEGFKQHRAFSVGL